MSKSRSIISVNPGSDLPIGVEVLSEISVATLAQECAIPGLTYERVPAKDDGERFAYTFRVGKKELLILMPGYPSEEMKKPPSEDPPPPRIFVGAEHSSWYWQFAIHDIRSSLLPVVSTLQEASRREEDLIGQTDNDVSAYQKLIRSFLLGLVEDGLDIDPKIDLTAENILAVRAKAETALQGVDADFDWPEFLNRNRGPDINLIAANPFPGVEYGKPLKGLKLLKDCSSMEEYRTQVIPSIFGDLFWCHHPRGISWKDRFQTADGTAWVDIDQKTGNPQDRCWPTLGIKDQTWN